MYQPYFLLSCHPFSFVSACPFSIPSYFLFFFFNPFLTFTPPFPFKPFPPPYIFVSPPPFFLPCSPRPLPFPLRSLSSFFFPFLIHLSPPCRFLTFITPAPVINFIPLYFGTLPLRYCLLYLLLHFPCFVHLSR